MVRASGLPVSAFLAVAIGLSALAQPTTPKVGRLPLPTGAFAVGRMSLVCEDSSRIEPLDANGNVRRIAIDVWYPAEAARVEPNASAEYIDVNAFEHAIGADGLRKQLGASYGVIKMGVATHARLNAPFNGSLRSAPVLIFSPGGGMIKELYTSQMEDLASNGYIAVALTHSYDGFLSLFPNGTSVAYDSKRWPKIPSLEGEANLNQLQWHSDDILFVLHDLARLNDDSSSRMPISGHMDLSKVGAFGHSFGGVAAAHACQKDVRVKACLNQDGAMAMKPFYPDVRGWGMDQAFMFIERPPNRRPLTDADLAEMKVSRERANQLIERLNASRDRVLRSTGGGSYRVLLQRDRTTHMDFSDLPLLAANNPTELQRRMDVMKVVTTYTRAFFNRYLRGMKEPLLEREASDPLIESIEHFGPASRPR